MICVLCDSNTKITNSRNRNDGHTWRRHTCSRCRAVFTTRETIDMSLSYRVQYDDGSMASFNDEILRSSLVDAVNHRTDALEVIGPLTETITAKLIKLKRLLIDSETISKITAETLKNFDRQSYVRYLSMRR